MMVPDLIFLISFLKKSFVKTVTQVRDVWIEVRERAPKPHLMLPSKLTCHVAGYSGCTWKTTVPPTVWLSRFESWVSRVEALGIPHFPLLHLGSLIFSSPLVLSWCLAFSTYAVSSLKQSFFVAALNFSDKFQHKDSASAHNRGILLQNCPWLVFYLLKFLWPLCAFCTKFLCSCPYCPFFASGAPCWWSFLLIGLLYHQKYGKQSFFSPVITVVIVPWPLASPTSPLQIKHFFL